MAARMNSFLRFRSFAERDACEVAVKEKAAQGRLLAHWWRSTSDNGEVNMCPLTVMEQVTGRDRGTHVTGIPPGSFTTPYDSLSLHPKGTPVSITRPMKASHEATAFALQQIRDADIEPL